MIKKLMILAVVLTVSFAFATNLPAKEKESASVEKTLKIADKPEVLSAEEERLALYEAFEAVNSSMPSQNVFTDALKGYEKLEAEDHIEKEILTVVDFSLPSTEKRMWILDMTTKKVLFHTYVSHGKNTGGKMATKFSNTPNSLQSSLGFYVTAETYYGKNGLSLFIDGMEEGFNDNARDRYVVVHGADYANPGAIKRLGRLGRSYGCPAVPTALSKDIINTIKGKSVLFIYHPNKNYLQNSQFLNPQVA
ncbi:murein L,D-transpeptidase catalytic domain family protein [Salinimicrobium soli]|uniref:murein L,D-transpeptidase catalytic domain family protein n=1 Tax=Salinimicrobium soli TaxID=1254399 RepID=UPI003AAA4483